MLSLPWSNKQKKQRRSVSTKDAGIACNIFSQSWHTDNTGQMKSTQLHLLITYRQSAWLNYVLMYHQPVLLNMAMT